MYFCRSTNLLQHPRRKNAAKRGAVVKKSAPEQIAAKSFAVTFTAAKRNNPS